MELSKFPRISRRFDNEESVSVLDPLECSTLVTFVMVYIYIWSWYTLCAHVLKIF